VATADRMKPPSIRDRQVEAALAVWCEPQWPALVELSTQATPAYPNSSPVPDSASGGH
jgi:hypothetical protein